MLMRTRVVMFVSSGMLAFMLVGMRLSMIMAMATFVLVSGSSALMVKLVENTP